MRLKIIKQIKRRGQVMVLYALLMPLMFLFVGVGLDLGWYYLNVSRLQNAADAAALAGAQTLVKQDDFNNYLVIALAPNKLPADFDHYANVFDNAFKENASATGRLYNYHKIEDIEDTLKEGRKTVEEYTRKNLEDSAEVNHLSDTTDTVSAVDGWSISTDAADKKVTGKIELKYKIVDGKNDVYGPLYYVVNLDEKIRHFFMPGWFDPMDAPVRAVVLLKPHYKGLIEPMQQLERTMVIDNWEYANKYKGRDDVYAGKWNHYQDVGVHYTNNNPYRTETVRVKPVQSNDSDGKTTSANSANGNTFYKETEVDSINIDFRAEIVVAKMFSADWDLGFPIPNFNKYNNVANNSWGVGKGDDKRILFNTEFNESFDTRDPTKPADPLWVRIESDPIIPQKDKNDKNVANYNSVRQITLNFNSKNTDTIISGANAGHYQFRPYVIFYTGPENIDYATDDNGVLKRHSQPVVINLNEDLNAIMYFPDSPVVINGNGHKWTGSIIAKCFLQTVTSEEMTGRTPFYLWDGFNKPTKFPVNYTELTDSSGNTIYAKWNELLDGNYIDTNYADEDFTKIDVGNGMVNIYEKFPIPEYFLLEYTKADHDHYAVTENDKLNENKTFAAYVNATYKEKFKTYSGLDDSQISAIKFPDENYNETTATYYVATDDLEKSNSNPDTTKYVKVLLDGDADKVRYVDKSKLPYVKVRTDKEYFYVCVYDLKLTTYQVIVNGKTTTGKGVRMIENSYTDEELNKSYKKSGNVSTTIGDIYVNPNTTYGDSWAVDRTWYDKHHGEWKKDELQFDTKNGFSYFKNTMEITSLSDKLQLVGKYLKVTVDGETKIIDLNNNNYYTKVYNNAKDHNNYIIVDKNGNMLTKAITPQEVLTARDVDANTTLKKKVDAIFSRASDKPLIDYWKTYTRDPKDPAEIPGDRGGTTDDGQYVGLSEYRMNEDYRIPALERVYKAHDAFNLNTGSMYSYFQIPELWRVNYTYLNVDEINHTVDGEPVTDDSLYHWKVEDMFFTTTRAEWID